ncbi:unnamed protein product [Porites lobata]|uniref:Uncharacterized protein n=1 Tax=Porites lobata TaxID=104759 RepID=A0ABN8RCH0_9CNID|nr:unnamed protein product [Porites lobata]
MHSSTVLATNITSSLSLQLQCDEAKKKAMRVLGILQRNLSLCDQSVKAGSYLSLVYPIQLLQPLYSTVSSMLTDLMWPSLQSRHRICDLGMV